MSTLETSATVGEARTKKKLRKGAVSCRECKRRKTRCCFLSAADAICVGCERRGTPCRSQELDDDAAIEIDGPSVRARLLKVERLLGKLIEKVLPEEVEGNGDGPDERGSSSPGSQNSTVGFKNIGGLTRGNSVSSSSELGSLFANMGGEGHQSVAQPRHPVPSRNEDSPVFQEKAADTDQNIAEILFAALPAQNVVDAIINGRSAVALQIVCNSYSDIFAGNLQPLSDLTKLPTKSSHPILLARKLLQLAVCIQQLDPSFDDPSLALTQPLAMYMTKYFELATTLVTIHDRFIDTLEGIECVLLEGVFLINSGNIRRAWMCFRRTMNFAQFMGLHKATPKRLRILDSKTKVSCSAAWFHIFYAERYLSLLLGVPSGISSNSFASEDNMQGATIDRLQRVHGVICGLIIQRNETQAFQDFTTTSKIDFEMQKAVKSTDAKWWMPPTFDLAMGSLELMEAVMRSHTQIMHHHLLIMVHLPFMLRDSSERIYDYSKAACVYASREILTRWNSFRSFLRVVFCCRWLDFCAFTASLTLLLAHLDSLDNSTGGDSQHRRLSDRALAEAAMDTMDELNRVNGDQLTKQTADLTRRLLDIEENASRRAFLYSSRSKGPDTEDGTQSPAFELEIPFFGTVTIARQRRRPDQSLTAPDNPQFSQASNTYPPWSSSSLLPPPVESFNSVGGLDSMAENTWQLPLGQFGDSHCPTGGFLDPLLSLQDVSASQNITMTDLVAAEDDWTFQGVDAAFFDSIMKGNVTNSGDWGHNWSDWDSMH